jgi:hypothetical protein
VIARTDRPDERAAALLWSTGFPTQDARVSKNLDKTKLGILRPAGHPFAGQGRRTGFRTPDNMASLSTASPAEKVCGRVQIWHTG